MSELFDLNDLLLFCQVVQEGSFAGAARRFRGSKATISRRVALLEQRLGAQLLIRTTRTVRTTEVGRDFYGRAQGILAAPEDALLSISRTRGEPSGLLRVTAGVEFGSEFIDCMRSTRFAARLVRWGHGTAVASGRRGAGAAARNVGGVGYG